METDAILQDRRMDILQIATSHGARTVRIFGSMARGEAGPVSYTHLTLPTITE